VTGTGGTRRRRTWTHRLAPVFAAAAIGTATVVTSVGFVGTSTARVERAFADQSTEVVVDDLGTGLPAAPMSFPADAGDRVRALAGVSAAGLWWPIRRAGAVPPAVSSAPKGDPAGVSVTAAEPDALAALHVRPADGRLFDVGHQRRAERVAVLGAGAAEALALGDLGSGPSVYVDGVTYAVLGVIDPASGPPDLGLSVVLPTATALAAYGPPVQPRAVLVVDASAAYASAVAGQVATVLRPQEPERFSVHRAPPPTAVEDATLAQLRRLMWVFSGLTLILAAGLMALVVPRAVRVAPRAGSPFALQAAGAALLGSVLATNVVVAALWLGARGGDPVVLPRVVVVLAVLVPALTTLAFVLRATRAPRVTAPRPAPRSSPRPSPRPR
jgi:putative ABC transport system permease protein